MKTPQVVMGVAAVVLIVLLFTSSPRQTVARYNAATETTVRGVVQEVQEFSCPISGGLGTHLVLRTDNRTLQVHVAPEWFVRGRGVTFAKGDLIEVTGAPVKFEGTDGLIARQIVRGHESFAFRTPTGKTVWTE